MEGGGEKTEARGEWKKEGKRGKEGGGGDRAYGLVLDCGPDPELFCYRRNVSLLGVPVQGLHGSERVKTRMVGV